MKKGIGMILMSLGIILLVWACFTYAKKEKVIDISPVQVSIEVGPKFNWPLYSGGLLIVCGITLLLMGNNNEDII